MKKYVILGVLSEHVPRSTIPIRDKCDKRSERGGFFWKEKSCGVIVLP